MASFENLTIKDLNMLAKARSVDIYENMFRQQLWNIFTTPSMPKPTPTSAPKLAPKKILLRQVQDPKNLS